MKKILITLAFLNTVFITLANAQSFDTTIVETSRGDGGTVERTVQYEKRSTADAANSFQEADKNGDNCVNAKEAYDSGILNFNKYSKNKKCLTEAEFDNAMKGD